MKNTDGVTVVVVVIVCALVALVAWLHITFSPQFALAGIILLGSGFFIVVGILLAASIQRATLGSVSQFNERDAKIDRYRQEAFRDLVKGQVKVQTLEAKRVDQIAEQRARLITDVERERLELKYQQQERGNAWAVDDIETTSDFQEWR